MWIYKVYIDYFMVVHGVFIDRVPYFVVQGPGCATRNLLLDRIFLDSQSAKALGVSAWILAVKLLFR